MIKLNEILQQVIKELEDQYESFFDSENINIGLMSGNAGIALFYSYLFHYTKDNKYSNKAIELFNCIHRRINDSPQQIFFDYAEGLIGVLLSFNHIYKNQLVPTYFNKIISDKDIDNILEIRGYNLIQDGNIDFFYGSAGFLYYWISMYEFTNNDIYRKKINSFITKIYKSDTIENRLLAHDSWIDYQFDFGIPHGFSSWLILLSKIYKYNIEMNKSISIIRNILNRYIPYLERMTAKSNFVFPEVANNQPLKKSRMGWCYGDLSCLLALINLKSINCIEIRNIWIDNLLKHVASRRGTYKNLVYDCAICHGGLGIATIFKSLVIKYNYPFLSESLNYWQQESINLYELFFKENGFKKRYFSENNEILIPEYNFLEGISGIGLACLGLLDNYYLKWKDFLLI